MMDRLDLNADLGEECGDDIAMLNLVTSANISCGAHAGGNSVMRATISASHARGVAVGAHPSYPDRPNFGRTTLLGVLEDAQIAQSLTDQLHEFLTASVDLGVAVSYVKPHGALYHDAMTNDRAASLLLGAVQAVESENPLPIMGIQGSVLHQRCLHEGRRFITEAFADRAYQADGTLVPRSAPGAVLTTSQAIAQTHLLIGGSVRAIDGTILPAKVDSICVHGDTPDAVLMAGLIREQLAGAGIEIRPVVGH
jgi:5-oxoprolinase (ATP-hydrolysing) subunit A